MTITSIVCSALRFAAVDVAGRTFILLPSGSCYVGILDAPAKPRQIRVDDDAGNVIETHELHRRFHLKFFEKLWRRVSV